MTEINQVPPAIWERLAASLPDGVRRWRQDGKPVERQKKHWARFVPFISASFVADRLNEVALGQWAISLEALQTLDAYDQKNPGTIIGHTCAVKARLIVFGVAREDIGQGKDYKAAATDAFKRAAMRFGIGRELQDMAAHWVEMDGDGAYAKPREEPEAAWLRKLGGTPAAAETPVPDRAAAAPDAALSCPKCGGAGMYDNRASKRNPKAPDFKCSKRGCDGAIWPEKAETPSRSRS